MVRFEQLVLSDRRDDWGIPRRTGAAIVNVDEICLIRDATVDTTFQAYFSPACPRGVFAAVEIILRGGELHTLQLGQFDDVADADHEIDRFASWLTGCMLL